MNSLRRLPVRPKAVAAVILLAALLLPVGFANSAAPSSALAAPPAARTAACSTAVDGYANFGTRVAGIPPRWEYGTSPYIGGRFNECTDTLTVYFGGYTGNTHYNIRWSESGSACIRGIQCGQIEVGPGLRRSHRIGGNQLPALALVSVQACKRGGLFQSSTCTRWSPTLRFPRPLVGNSG